ncbi:MAG: GNAT family N-acetyltransferase [Elusimicrobiota bacterium]|nr:GNAT family N-acetyltransferase [Elusimicrobiota bacterium]
MTVRPATRADLPAVTAIYNDAVARTTGTFDTTPRTLAEQERWFAAHGASHPVLVAEEGGAILGWASLSGYSDRCAYSRTAEVSVYVAEDARGRGVGGGLLDAVLAAGRAAGVKEVIARIAEGNETSLKLHAKRGFEEVGRLRKVGEKFGRLLDVFFLQKSLALLLLALAATASAAGTSDDAVRESALALAGGDVARARQHAEAAVKADPGSAKAWLQYASAALAGQEHAAGRDAAERAIAIGGETPALLVLRAQGRGGLGDLEGALADTGRALRLQPASARSRLERARVLEAMGRAEEALADYDRAAALDVLLAEEAFEARRRLAPAAPRRSTGVGGLFALLGFSALVGWAWARFARPTASAPAAPRVPAPPRLRPAPLGDQPLAPRAALQALAKAAGDGGPDEAHALALALHARLLDRASIVGAETFFARALNADPAARFRTPAELLNAFRALVDPPVL